VAEKVLYGILLGYPGTRRREETLGKLESLGWFATHADWQQQQIPGRLVKLTPGRYRELAEDKDFEPVTYPREGMVLLVLKIPEGEVDQLKARGTDITFSLQ